MTDKDLSRLQRDILELESRTWSQPGEKISAFKRLHPTVTETGYYLALLGLLSNPVAYEIHDRRYAAMLSRLSETQKAEYARRVGLRGVSAQ